MKLTILGSGTSHGIPVIGCTCPVCQSLDERDKRWRSSLLVEDGDTSFVIDTGYEFRLQMLRAGVKMLDGVIYTHAHSDHLMGLDDLRVFCRDRDLDIFAPYGVLEDIIAKFPYAFRHKPGMGLPQLKGNAVEPHKPFMVGSVEVVPIPVMHGSYGICGYRFGKAAYITDVSDILIERNRDYLQNLDILIIGALREKPHHTHYSFSQAVEATRELKAKRLIFTHINHATSHGEIAERYKGVAEPAYDMLTLEV